jgi:hypothetical protein
MDPNSKVSRPIILGASLTALFFCATAMAQSPWKKTPCKSNPMSHNIEVGAEVSCKLAFVSKGKSDTVAWKSIDTAKPYVMIEFQWPNPYQHMTDCDGTKPICRAEGLGAPPDETKIFLYTAKLCDGATPNNCVEVTDPGIIIKP